MRHLFVYCICSALLFACSESKKTPTITGTLNNVKGNKILMLEHLSTTAIKKLDSAKVNSDGSFAFTYPIENTGFYRISAGNQNFFNLILTPDDKAVIAADADNMGWTYEVTGSEESKKLKQLNNHLSGIFKTSDSLNQKIRMHQQRGDYANYAAALQFQQQLNQKQFILIKQFIDQNLPSLATLAAVKKLDPDKDFAYYDKVEKALGETLPNSDYYLQLKEQVDELRKLAIGSPAPDINLPTPDGNTLALTSLKGKVVLVDFWASWCKPCRAENPNVKKAYNKYKDKGFEILGVSLDKQKKAWVNAIEKDGLPWKHISDLAAWQSSVVPLYSIKGIPLTYLIDRDGTIIAKNLRGEALHQKLAEIFGE